MWEFQPQISDIFMRCVLFASFSPQSRFDDMSNELNSKAGTAIHFL